MKICHFFEFENYVSGGINESVRHQRKAMDIEGIEFTTEPDLGVDVLDINLMGPRSVVLALRAKKNGIPVVIHPHVTAEDFSGSFRFSTTLSTVLEPYLDRVYPLADRLVCPSAYNREIVSEYADCTVITNGVDGEKLDGFEDLREEYLERYDLSPPVVFCVGHVFKRKGLKDFVETAEAMPELDFAWFGPLDLGMKDRKTRKTVEESPDNVTFTGFVDDIRGGFAAGDVFFFPTFEENEGIALLEALYCGKPVLVRDIPVFDWLDHRVNCFKSDDFTAALEELKDEQLRDELGNNARNAAEAFSIERVGKRLHTVYESVQQCA